MASHRPYFSSLRDFLEGRAAAVRHKPQEIFILGRRLETGPCCRPKRFQLPEPFPWTCTTSPRVSGPVRCSRRTGLPRSRRRSCKFPGAFRLAETRMGPTAKNRAVTMKHSPRHSADPARDTTRLGSTALHGSASSPGLPNLAGAQIPGPGTGHLLYGEGGRLTDAAADPWELEGHLGSAGGFRRFVNRLLGR